MERLMICYYKITAFSTDFEDSVGITLIRVFQYISMKGQHIVSTLKARMYLPL